MQWVHSAVDFLGFEDFIVGQNLWYLLAFVGSETYFEETGLDVDKIAGDSCVFEQFNCLVFLWPEHALDFLLLFFNKQFELVLELLEVNVNHVLLLDSQDFILVGLEFQNVKIDLFADELTKAFVWLGGFVEDGEELFSVEVGFT